VGEIRTIVDTIVTRKKNRIGHCDERQWLAEGCNGWKNVGNARNVK